MRLVLAICLAQLALPTFAQEDLRMAAPIVFFDIAGPDTDALNTFYSEIFGWDIAEGGGFSTSVVSPMPGTTRQDPPGTMFYIGVDDVTATLEKIEESGGAIDSPRMEVPGVVVLGLFKDPAGNRVGLVEMHDGEAKIP